MSRKLKPNDPLPSMRKLDKDLHISIITTQRAYDELRENYGIIHGGKELLESLIEDNIIGIIKEPYHYSVLVNNRIDIQKTFVDLEISRPTVEEIMLFYVKGAKKLCQE